MNSIFGFWKSFREPSPKLDNLSLVGEENQEKSFIVVPGEVNDSESLYVVLSPLGTMEKDLFPQLADYLSTVANLYIKRSSPNAIRFVHRSSRECGLLSSIPTWDVASTEISSKNVFYVSSLCYPSLKNTRDFVDWLRKFGVDVSQDNKQTLTIKKGKDNFQLSPRTGLSFTIQISNVGDFPILKVT